MARAPMAVRPLGPASEPSSNEPALDVELFATAISWVSLAAVRIVLLAAAGFFLAGWLYLTAFFSFFHMPVLGMEISPSEILLQGVHSLLFPTAFGIIDAGQQATATRTHFVLTTNANVGLPGGTTSGNTVEYRNFVLLRETPTRYWMMRLGLATDVYSVAKDQVLYVRY